MPRKTSNKSRRRHGRGAAALPLSPVLFPAATSAEQKRMAALKKAGRITRVGPRLYVSVPHARAAEVVRQSWAIILAQLFPAVLISHRTALEFTPTDAGDVYVTTAGMTHSVRYPGLTIHFVRGPGPLSDDPRFMGLRSSSIARAFLENVRATAITNGRALPNERLEARLEQILHLGGETELNALRDRAREIAEELAWRPAFKRLDTLIGALLGTRAGALRSEVGRARAGGEPFDAGRVERLQILFGQLRDPFPELADTFAAKDHFRNKAFFEAYFSNYIEGTTFEIAEAEEIVFDKKVPPSRPKDAHDILGTFEIVSDVSEMRRTPASFEDLVDYLRARHQRMMAGRPEAAPGHFKSRPNRAGETEFVHPDYVEGTLRKAFELYRDVSPGLPRAIFMMFLVSEVHPFVDGNGRMARIMMNAELVSRGLATVIIPTVYRDDYITALRALSRRDRPLPLVQALVKAQQFSNLEFSPYPRVLAVLTQRNWFRDPDEARIVV